MAEVIVPVAQPLMLCEEIDVEGGSINVYALFDALHAATFPYTRDSFAVFAQLSGGLGEIPVHYDIVRARDDRLIHTSHVHQLRFERRTQLIQLVTNFERITFEEPGVYLVQLFCDNTWIADVTLELLGND
jgi:hypothetical protein